MRAIGVGVGVSVELIMWRGEGAIEFPLNITFSTLHVVGHHLNLCVVFSTQPTRATSIQPYSVSEIVGLHHGVAGTWSWYFLMFLGQSKGHWKNLVWSWLVWRKKNYDGISTSCQLYRTTSWDNSYPDIMIMVDWALKDSFLRDSAFWSKGTLPIRLQIFKHVYMCIPVSSASPCWDKVQHNKWVSGNKRTPFRGFNILIVSCITRVVPSWARTTITLSAMLSLLCSCVFLLTAPYQIVIVPCYIFGMCVCVCVCSVQTVCVICTGPP